MPPDPTWLRPSCAPASTPDLLRPERAAGGRRAPAGRLRRVLPNPGLAGRRTVRRQRLLGVERKATTGAMSGCSRPSSPADRRDRHMAQRPPPPLIARTRSLHRPGRTHRDPPGRRHGRRRRPHNAGRETLGADRRGRGPQGVRGPQPTGEAQARRAGRAWPAGGPARLGCAQRRGAGARPRRSRPGAHGPRTDDDRPGLEPPGCAGGGGEAVDSSDPAPGSSLFSDGRTARARLRSEREGARGPAAGHLGASRGPPDLGPGSGRAVEPGAQHERPNADEVPADGVGPLQDLPGPDGGASTGRPHEALRVRRQPPRSSARDRRQASR